MGSLSRREFMKRAGAVGALLGAIPLDACATGSAETPTVPPTPADETRLKEWASTVYQEGLASAPVPLGRRAARVGELAIGTPYQAYTLEEYLKAGGDPTKEEPLTLSLTRFDCVTLVESSIAVARSASDKPSWNQFAGEIGTMRYRGGVRRGFASRLHYFSEWISDGGKRGLVSSLGERLGGVADTRPLRFMTEHRASYPGLKDDSVYAAIGEMEHSLDVHPRYVIPTLQIEAVSDRIQSGDVLGFATSIPGLDVTHAAFAYRDKEGELRVLHAPLSGGSVEISRLKLPDYVAAIKRSTGILIARPQLVRG